MQYDTNHHGLWCLIIVVYLLTIIITDIVYDVIRCNYGDIWQLTEFLETEKWFQTMGQHTDTLKIQFNRYKYENKIVNFDYYCLFLTNTVCL